MMTNESSKSISMAISIVSHGHGFLVKELLNDLKRLSYLDNAKVIVTLNIPEDESYLIPYINTDILILRNKNPIGFGENHNKAFLLTESDCFVVLNPDVRLLNVDFWKLYQNLKKFNYGCISPLVVNENNEIEDNFREFPTIKKILKRKLLKNKKIRIQSRDEILTVDWVAGIAMVFDMCCYKAVNGFDERYYMYLEDTDICKRITEEQNKLIALDCTQVIQHKARRDSRKKLKYMIWHINSFIKFLLSTNKRYINNKLG